MSPPAEPGAGGTPERGDGVDSPIAFREQLAELIRSSPHNLVSHGAGEALRERHIPEAELLAAQLGAVEGRWLDLGTGGGLPGLVLAQRLRGAEWVLLDATQKKIDEVARFAASLDVSCETAAGRAEDLAWRDGWRGGFDGVVARAVAPLRSLVELARGFLDDGGMLAAVKGSRWREEVDLAHTAFDRTAMTVTGVERLGEGGSVVVWVRAHGPVPDAIPRRAGVPVRRPL